MTPEQLDERRRSLGGSELGQIPEIVEAVRGDPSMDCAPWASEWRVWASKVYGPEGQPDTPEMAVGRWLERPVMEWAAGELGGVLRPMRQAPTWRAHPISGTPDGWIDFADGRESEGVEAKVSGDWQPWESPPLYYELQCRAYLYLTGAPRWYLAAYFRVANARRLYAVEYDAGVEALMVEAAHRWWQRRVVDMEPPEVDASADCARALQRLHPRTAGASYAAFREATTAEIHLATELHRLRALSRDVKRDVESLENTLRSAIGHAPGLRWSGGSVRWSSNRLAVKLESE